MAGPPPGCAALGSLLGGLLVGGVPFLGFRAPVEASPVGGVLWILMGAAGFPLVLLATTSTFAQLWARRRCPGVDPYPLYAWSNAGSLAGLLAYPFLLEPWTSLRTQAWILTVGFLVYGALLGVHLREAGSEGAEEAPEVREAPSPVPVRSFLGWVGLAALGTGWLMAQSSHLALTVASIPLLWVLPLGVFLGTFIVAFDPPRWFQHRATPRIMVGVLGLYALVLALPAFLRAWFGGVALVGTRGTLLAALIRFHGWSSRDPRWVVVQDLVALAAGGLLCHGLLAARKPEVRSLTAFYLAVAVGGTVGGLALGVGAPLLFQRPLEGYAVLGLTFLVTLPAFRAKGAWAHRGGFILGAVGLGVTLVGGVGGLVDPTYRYARDFFGVVKVSQPHPNLIQLNHGNTVHGVQFAKEPLRPAAYYGEASGIGRAIRHLQAQRSDLDIGVIGLGVGNVMGYGRAQDRFRVYEISPAVIRTSGPQGQVFQVVQTTPARVEVLEGDGRILLQRDVAQGHRFDVLLVDAFVGGNIPIHLLTREALDLYGRALKPGGILALHVSHALPLEQQVALGLQTEGWSGLLIHTPPTLGKTRWGRLFYVEMPSLYWLATRETLEAWPKDWRDQAIDVLKSDSPSWYEGRAILGRPWPWTDERHSVVDLWRWRR